jgi:hypothetical protein
MRSKLMLEYLRTGAISPLKKADGKSEVKAKLGPPNDWKGREAGFDWEGSLVTDYHDSWAWHYGSLCVSFPKEGLSGPLDISLNYMGGLWPISFPSPFDKLPQAAFTLRELIDLMDNNSIQFNDYRGERDSAILVSEGGVGVATAGGNCSPGAEVIYLFPDKFVPT